MSDLGMWLEHWRPQGPAFNSSEHKTGLWRIGDGADHQPVPVTGLSKQKSKKLCAEGSVPRLGHHPVLSKLSKWGVRSEKLLYFLLISRSGSPAVAEEKQHSGFSQVSAVMSSRCEAALAVASPGSSWSWLCPTPGLSPRPITVLANLMALQWGKLWSATRTVYFLQKLGDKSTWHIPAAMKPPQL